jgi:hypothetical protein
VRDTPIANIFIRLPPDHQWVRGQKTRLKVLQLLREREQEARRS